MADSVRDSIVVRAPTEAVLDTVADVRRYPQWQPEITAVEVLESTAEGRPLRAHFVIDAKLVQVSCTLAYRYDASGMHWSLVDGDGLERNDGSYLIADLGDGRTELTYVLDVRPTMPVPDILRRQIAKRIVDSALDGVRVRAEADR